MEVGYKVSGFESLFSLYRKLIINCLSYDKGICERLIILNVIWLLWQLSTFVSDLLVNESGEWIEEMCMNFMI